MIALLLTTFLLAPGVAADDCAQADASVDSCYFGYVGTPVYEVCVIPYGCASERIEQIKEDLLPSTDGVVA